MTQTPEQRAAVNRRYNQTPHAKELTRARDERRRAKLTKPKPPKRPVAVVRAEFEFMLRQATENDWAHKIRCLGKPEQYVDYSPSERPYASVAAAMCAGCPMRELCLERGKAEPWADGVYGGVVFIDGKVRVEDFKDLAA